jgi:Ca2+-binding RTX toxin-like protein
MSEKANETKPSETKPKKMVKKNIAIALGIACVILIAGLGSSLGYYVMTMNNKDGTITNLTDKIDFVDFTVLADNQTVNQTAGNYNSWAFVANGSGYVSVIIWSSTTNDTYVRVIYNATIPTWSEVSGAETNYKWTLMPEGAWENYQYDNQAKVANGFSQLFPVLLSFKGPTIVEVRVGSTNASENAAEQVTIVYYY